MPLTRMMTRSKRPWRASKPELPGAPERKTKRFARTLTLATRLLPHGTSLHPPNRSPRNVAVSPSGRLRSERPTMHLLKLPLNSQHGNEDAARPLKSFRLRSARAFSRFSTTCTSLCRISRRSHLILTSRRVASSIHSSNCHPGMTTLTTTS